MGADVGEVAEVDGGDRDDRQPFAYRDHGGVGAAQVPVGVASHGPALRHEPNYASPSAGVKTVAQSCFLRRLKSNLNSLNIRPATEPCGKKYMRCASTRMSVIGISNKRFGILIKCCITCGDGHATQKVEGMFSVLLG